VITRKALPFPVGATLRARFSAFPDGLEQQLSLTFLADDQQGPKIILKRTPWGWLHSPDALAFRPGRPAPEGPVTMIIERADKSTFRFYWDHGEGPVLIGWGGHPRVADMALCDIGVEAFSTLLAVEAYFLVDDLTVSRREHAATRLQPDEVISSLEAKALAMHENQRRVLLPMRKALIAPQTGRQLSFPLRTPDYAQDLALLFVGFFHAADDSGDGGMHWRLRDAEGDIIRQGFNKNRDVWVWVSAPVAPDRSYSLEVVDEDSDFSGQRPGNGAWIGAMLSLFGDAPAGRTPTIHPVHAGPEWVDVLPLIDLQRDVLAGNWVRDGEDLQQNSPIRARSGLQLPVGADESYELELAFTRLTDNESLNLRIPLGNRHPDIVVGGYPDNGHASVIRFIHDPQPDGRRNPTWTVGSALESNRRYLLNLQVRLRDDAASIRATLDGESLFDWQGPQWNELNVEYGIFPFFAPTFAIGNFHGTMAFHSVRLRSLRSQ
jgi:hypothetical protein